MKNFCLCLFIVFSSTLFCQEKSDRIYKWKSGKDTTIIGKAMNAKGGAVIIDLYERTYYIEGVDSWHEKLEGKMLRVTGRLAKKEFAGGNLPANKEEPLVASMEGDMDVITTPKWKLIKK